MSWYRGCEDFVSENVPLARMTSYRVGGPAKFLAAPPDSAALSDVLNRAAGEGLAVRSLGHGSNLLAADAGVDGMIIRLPRSGFGSVECAGTSVRAGSAHSLSGLVKWSVSQGLRGLECLYGIPGTVGAALRMNSGGKHGEIGGRVRRVWGVERDGEPMELRGEQCAFGYRNSGLNGRIVTGCELELEAGDPAAGEALISRILREKCASQPLAARSAGCVFKNPRQPGVPAAGQLIDELGLKGLRMGGASVSSVHANFLVCEGQAAASDLVQLIRLIRQRVFEARGVLLELEVEVWGVEPEELMPPGCTHAA